MQSLNSRLWSSRRGILGGDKLVNPDGPDAATHIDALETQIRLLGAENKSLKARNKTLEDEIRENGIGAKHRRRAEQRAISRWEAEHSIKREWPWKDHADLCFWLMGQLDAAEKDRDDAINWAESLLKSTVKLANDLITAAARHRPYPIPPHKQRSTPQPLES